MEFSKDWIKIEELVFAKDGMMWNGDVIKSIGEIKVFGLGRSFCVLWLLWWGFFGMGIQIKISFIGKGIFKGNYEGKKLIIRDFWGFWGFFG